MRVELTLKDSKIKLEFGLDTKRARIKDEENGKFNWWAKRENSLGKFWVKSFEVEWKILNLIDWNFPNFFSEIFFQSFISKIFQKFS